MGHPLSTIVWHVEDSGTVITKFPNGNTFEVHNPATDLEIGDIITVDSETLEYRGFVSDTGYDVGNLIGIIKEKNDETILATINGTMRKVRNPHNVDIEEGFTVEVDEAFTIQSVVAEYTISQDLFERNTSELIANFRQSFDSDEESEGDEEDRLSFNDFGGMTKQHQHLVRRTKLLLTKRSDLVKVGADIQMGALFYGSPGTGKTHFARILSSQIDATFYRVRGPEIVSKMVGDTEKLVRDIFEDAKEHEPSVIFFDEIDSIAADRSKEGQHEFSQRLVAQLLSVIDGFDKEEHRVFIIAATNQINEIDKALLRPGRFSWQVEFPEPTDDVLVDIFNALKRRYEISENVTDKNIKQLFEMADGWTGASIKDLLNEVAIVCVEDGRNEIEYIDLRKGYDRVAEQEERRE